jgi:hypothetical protein
MKLFTKHPSTVNQTWWKHCIFAACVGLRLLVSGFLFLIHGAFPFINIPMKFNLQYMSQWLNKQNISRKK